MSNEQVAILRKDKVPTRDEWQAAIDACGFDLQLDPNLVPFEVTGFVPCKLLGTDAGFEIFYDGFAETLDCMSGLLSNRDFCISFYWSASSADRACVMVACYVLAKQFEAVVCYAEDDAYEELDDLLSDTLASIEDAKNDL